MPVTSIRDKVAEEIKALSPRVETELVDIMIEREVKKRTDALVVVYDKLSTATKDHAKLGPDNVTYNADGSKASESFSKKRIDEINKAKGQVDKLTKTINKALDAGDFGDVYNLSSGKDPQPDRTGSGSETSDDTAG